jgi:UPF0755 protein
MNYFRNSFLSAGNFLKALPLQDRVLVAFFGVALISALLFVFCWSAPLNAPYHETVRIEDGVGLTRVAEILHEHRVVKSKFWFKVFAVLENGHTNIKAGDYFFNSHEPVMDVAKRLVKGEYGLTPERVTIFEGLSVPEIAELLHKRFNLFDADEFVKYAPEGYLFPDTYFFLQNASSGEVIKRMRTNFDKKMAELEEEVMTSELSLEEIITLASILEEEAGIYEDKRIIAGIMLRRLELEMPLQVDSTFSYVNGKNTYELTHEDLEIESPYNSYRNKGLPPTPISNPGLESIHAALNPKDTDYLYFLSDLAGNMYYAEDFEGHQQNRLNYLRK